MLISVIFYLWFTAMGIAVIIELFEILPTLSKKRGQKVTSPYRQKARNQNLEEYYSICKNLNKPLFWYYYTKWIYANGMHVVIIFLLISILYFLAVII